MASYAYVDSPNPNLVRSINLGNLYPPRSPFVDPCTTRTCSHTFCYDCISQAIAINSQCPIDRTPLSLHDLLPADPVVRNLVDELTVKCTQEPQGCPYTCQRLLLPVHLRDTCQYVYMSCPGQGCSQRVLKKDVNDHCNHQSDSAGAAQQPLQPSDAQCTASQGQVTNVSTAASPSQPPPAVPFSDLAAENSVLRLRLAALENIVHTLRSEMFAVKRALGPWYRPEVQPQFHEPEEVETSQATFSSMDSPTPEDTMAEGPPGLPAVPSATPLLDPSDIASYFPPPEETTSAPPSLRQRRVRAVTEGQRTQRPSASTSAGSHATIHPDASNSGFSHNTMYTPGSYSTPGSMPGIYPQGTSLPPVSPAAVSVPPLDPTIPLPDTLASLHSSLVTIAGALGALAAARSAESLRTAEELRGLRGAMHGLRMQVHDILTARTPLPGQGAGTSGNAHGDAEGAPPAMGTPPWPGYGPRPFGYGAMYPHPYPPPHLGMAHAPPTNITKL
ncbi:hypothetical protein BD413DRAFT_557726 [Trametes elegans]|nr:hypothetical protein BD413DRAFT_557726 [Trametes elegans]